MNKIIQENPDFDEKDYLEIANVIFAKPAKNKSKAEI